MNLSRCIRRLVFGDRVLATAATSLRNLVAWLFIALVAAFLTHPAGGPSGAFDAPAPWPAQWPAEPGPDAGAVLVSSSAAPGAGSPPASRWA